MDAETYKKACAVVDNAVTHANRVANDFGWEPYGGLWEDEASDEIYDQRGELGGEVHQLAQELLKERAQAKRAEQGQERVTRG